MISQCRTLHTLVWIRGLLPPFAPSTYALHEPQYPRARCLSIRSAVAQYLLKPCITVFPPGPLHRLLTPAPSIPPFDAFQVYSNPLGYQAALPPSTNASVEDEAEEREILSPLPPSSDGGGRGRKTSARMVVLPPRSPSEPSSSSNTSPTPAFFTSVSGGGVLPASAFGFAAAAVGGGGGGGDGGTGGGSGSAPASPNGGGLPDFLRQVGLHVRVLEDGMVL